MAIHHPTANGSPRRVASAPKLSPPPQPKSAAECSARKPPRRRAWKPPDPEAPPKTPLPSPPPPPVELDREEANAADGGGEAEDLEEEKASDDFDDKEMDLVEDDKRIVQIHELPEEKAEIDDAMVEIEPISESAGAEERTGWKSGSEEAAERCMQGGENRLQSVVDLLMWTDVPRSALVFGMGTFFFVSSSYTRDLNFSLISAISYAGLFYLAGIFLFNSILRRGEVEIEESKQSWLVGEDEALWLIRIFLPYVNEILIKVRALFSGDPSTTMKMAMLLFALARCGGCVTIWTMGKLAFFGMFTIPRFFASYSSQISRYGIFWVERCRDAWETCTHKKIAAAATFFVFWNISSSPARMWSVFMLAVALKYYQQCASQNWDYITEDEEQSEDPKEQEDFDGGLSQKGENLPKESSERGVLAGTPAEQPKGPNALKRRLGNGQPHKVEMGPKEKKRQ